MVRSFWMKPRTPTASGGRSTPGAAASVPISWIFSSWTKGPGQWERGEELHRERAYTTEELTAMLRQAGFSQIRIFGELKMRPPVDGEQRVFFTARKDK